MTLLALIGSGAGTGLNAATAADGAAAGAEVTVRLLAARVNGRGFEHATRMLATPTRGLLVPGAALRRWGLIIPGNTNPVRRMGTTYYSLRTFAGLTYSINQATQTLVVQVGANRFEASRIELGGSEFTAPRSEATGGFLNYDIVYQSRAALEGSLRGTFELGAFSRWGVLTTTMLTGDRRGRDDVVRLNTTLRHDAPGEMRTLILGDTFLRPGAWGRSVLYGGIKWGKNFATRPEFITFPLPDVRGAATVPALVEVYAENRRRDEAEVNAGPFSIQNIPVATGAGRIRVVVRDVLGRQHVITRSFYTSRALLREGLHDYTYELGAIRENYTRASFDYGRIFAAATHRIGLSERLTGGLRLELLADQQTFGLSGTWLVHPAVGVLSGAAAASSSDAGPGGLVSIGIQRQGRYLSFGARTTYTTADFRQLGVAPGESAPRQIVHANIGVSLEEAGALGLGYTSIERRTEADTRFFNASYSTSLFGFAALSVFVSRELESRETAIGLNVGFRLGGRASGSIGHSRDEDSFTNRISMQRGLPSGTGVGFRLAAADGHGTPDRARARVTARTQYGSYRATAARFRGETAYRLNAAGGIALLGGHVFATRRVDDSFAVVEVGDFEGVQLYNDNQPVARTGTDGAALVPDLRSFEENRLSFEQADLPLDVRVEQREATVVPGYRRGILVTFDVASSTGALIELRRANGNPVPAGATVRLVGSEQRHPVARRGMVWVTGLDHHNELVAEWGEHRCRFQVHLSDNPGPMPRIGPVTCRKVPP